MECVIRRLLPVISSPNALPVVAPNVLGALGEEITGSKRLITHALSMFPIVAQTLFILIGLSQRCWVGTSPPNNAEICARRGNLESAPATNVLIR